MSLKRLCRRKLIHEFIGCDDGGTHEWCAQDASESTSIRIKKYAVPANYSQRAVPVEEN